MFVPLLADLGDIIRVLIPIVVFIGWLISQFVQDQGPQGPVKRPKAGQPRPPKPVPPAIEDEIAEFLRQAQQRPQNNPQPQRDPRQPVRPVAEATRRIQPQPASEQRPRQLQKQQQTAPTRGAKPPRGKRLKENVGEHVRKHLDTGNIEKQTTQLGRRVRSADADVERHLHDVFDHQMGQLDEQPISSTIRDGTDDATWDTLDEQRTRSEAQRQLQSDAIFRMLSNPYTMREAIIVGELLKPPLAMRSDE